MGLLCSDSASWAKHVVGGRPIICGLPPKSDIKPEKEHVEL